MSIRRHLVPACLAAAAFAACGDDESGQNADTRDTSDGADTSDTADAPDTGDTSDAADTTAPDTAPAKNVRIYGCDGNMGDYLGAEFTDPGALLGLCGTLGGALTSDDLETRVKGIDPELVDLLYVAEAYDAIVIVALAADIARSHEGADIARHLSGVTAHGETCTSYAACLALVEQGKDIDYDGVSGPIALDDVGEPSVAYFQELCFGADNAIDHDLSEVHLVGDERNAAAQVPAPARDGPAPAAPLKIGAFLPMSGGLGFFGAGQSAAIRLALKDIADAGGVNGMEVELIEGDSGDGDDVADETLAGFLRDEIDVMFGAISSRVSLYVIDRVVDAGILMISPSNTSGLLTVYDDDGLYFRTAGADPLQGEAIAKLIADDGGGRVAVIARDDDYGQVIAESMQRALAASGVASADIELHMFPADADFEAIVADVAAFEPDAIALITFDEAIELLVLLDEKGIGARR